MALPACEDVISIDPGADSSKTCRHDAPDACAGHGRVVDGVSGRLARNLRVKRGIDWVLVLPLVIVLAPVWMAIVVAIVFDAIVAGEAPVVLVSERRRSANRTFRLLKFRVFRVQAWRDHLATRPDVSVKAIEREAEQLTRVGRLLKQCYLDELPQLFNILHGDMSLVGPRPYFEGDWARQPLLDIPARQFLPAGLVGPYQAVKGSVSGLEAVNALDSEYLEHLRTATASGVIGWDLALILRSVRTVLQARGL